ncbi:MAG: AAA family ATPase [Candidatus Melainabacteria bacterium]|nr:AAA family ATPase [Candidatus Melainabacteria bacterium]
MGLTDFVIRNYRSVRDVWLKLGRMNIIVGPNGCGKSNLYRAVYLMSATARGTLAREIAEEGGMPSILWSGDSGGYERGDRFQLSIITGDLQYDIHCGFVPLALRKTDTIFGNDPEIKLERVLLIKGESRSEILRRGRNEVKVRTAGGKLSDYTLSVPGNESVLANLRDPQSYPHLSRLRAELLGWRFYHQFRTDQDSPLRKVQPAVFTELMHHDGSDFVSALGTIMEAGDCDGLNQAVDEAFPGCRIYFEQTRRGLKLSFRTPGINRSFDASEISDGTLHYFCLLAALHSLKPPPVLAINEPETSIHPDLFEPLARLLCRASLNSQIWVTTHCRDLADFILEYSGCDTIELEKVEGETRLVGRGLGGYKEKFDFDEDED